jgi:uncharacterized membrane protein YhaH (DUF805 family)
MESLALFFSGLGRLAPKPFARAVVAVYAAAFLSQLLISPPVMLRIGLAAFALVQAMAMWAWFCLHAKRLRDADRPIGPAIVVLYALAMILLLLIIALVVGMTPGADGATAGGGTDVLISSYLVRALAGDPHPGFFAYVAVGILALIFAPMLIAMGFSIWTGTRPRATPAPTQP